MELEIAAMESAIAHQQRLHALVEREATAKAQKAEAEARTAERIDEHVKHSFDIGKPPVWGTPRGDS